MLSNNEFSVLPTIDIQPSLKRLYVKGVLNLIDFPQPYDENGEPRFLLLENLTLEYETHCCWYKDFYTYEVRQIKVDQNKSRRRSPTMEYTRSDHLVSCAPQPDAFHPCYDIIQFTPLRVAIWFIITAAVCGNILVMTVLIFSMIKTAPTVPQILITNLAAADFCLAIYLTFIAAADLHTAGRYENEAFNWERSAACKTAGFFAVFSSVASICLLAMITFERMTTIAFSYTGRRFMTIPKTVVVLITVWSIAFIFAILPAVGVSSYSKVCICLPFEANTSRDKSYIISLLIFTGIVCFFILICYVILFVRVKKTSSSLSGREELRIAFKMSVLVLTDFIIWTPIAVIGLTGVLRGESLVDVQTSKYLMIFVFPINCWVNPLLYSILQTAFRNQLCDMFAHCGLCKEYHQRRKARAQGLTYTAATSEGRKFRISSITSTTTFTSFLSLFSKRASVTSIGSNEGAQIQNFSKRKHRSHSSTSSDQPSIKEGNICICMYICNAYVLCTYVATLYNVNKFPLTQVIAICMYI